MFRSSLKPQGGQSRRHHPRPCHGPPTQYSHRAANSREEERARLGRATPEEPITPSSTPGASRLCLGVLAVDRVKANPHGRHRRLGMSNITIYRLVQIAFEVIMDRQNRNSIPGQLWAGALGTSRSFCAIGRSGSSTEPTILVTARVANVCGAPQVQTTSHVHREGNACQDRPGRAHFTADSVSSSPPPVTQTDRAKKTADYIVTRQSYVHRRCFYADLGQAHNTQCSTAPLREHPRSPPTHRYPEASLPSIHAGSRTPGHTSLVRDRHGEQIVAELRRARMEVRSSAGAFAS